MVDGISIDHELSGEIHTKMLLLADVFKARVSGCEFHNFSNEMFSPLSWQTSEYVDMNAPGNHECCCFVGG